MQAGDEAMQVDTRGLRREHQDKRLRIEFNDGEIQEVRLLVLSLCDEHVDCCGITYDLISTNRPPGVNPGSARWSDFASIKNFEVLGD